MTDHTPIPDAELDEMEYRDDDFENVFRLIAEVRALRWALIGVAERDGNCWCPGKRGDDEHEDFCIHAKAALPAPGERRE